MVAAAYAFAHFAVDLACAFAVFSTGTEPWGFLLYNLFAFAMQMPLGLLADIINKDRLFACFGILLVGVCCLFPSRGAIYMCLLGLGNGLFHIGGGMEVMGRHPNLAGPLGAFVAPGALGIYLGTLLGKGGRGIFPVLTALSAGLVWILSVHRSPKQYCSDSVELPDKNILLPGALLFLVVVLRSVGSAVLLPWKEDTLALVAVCAVVFGKMLGGILSDRLDARTVSITSLALSAILFLFSGRPIPGLAALLLFNMTMPITLSALSKALPNTKGLAFGTLTFALFLGFLPSYFGMAPISAAVMAAICLLSAVLLVPALKAGERL